MKATFFESASGQRVVSVGTFALLRDTRLVLVVALGAPLAAALLAIRAALVTIPKRFYIRR